MKPEQEKEPKFESEPQDIRDYNPEHQIDRDPEPPPKEIDPETDPLKEWEKRNLK